MKNGQNTEPDPFGMLLVLLRDMVVLKTQTKTTQQMLEHLIAQPGVPFDADSAKSKAEKDALAETVRAMKDVYPQLPDEFFQKYLR